MRKPGGEDTASKNTSTPEHITSWAGEADQWFNNTRDPGFASHYDKIYKINTK